MITLYVQSPTLYLAGSGIVIGATSATVTDLVDIYGNVLTMADFGSVGYITFEPDTSNAEAATFTGITANANGTYTLTGLKTVIAKDPYTETSGSVRSHAGGTKVVVTDNVAFWNTFVNKNNDSTVVGKLTLPNGANRPVLAADTDTATTNALVTYGQLARTAIAGGTVASTTLLGYVKISTNPVSSLSPIAVGDNDGRVPTQGENDALVGTSGTPSTSNKYVTEDDTATIATTSKIVRRLASGDITVPSSPTNSTDAASKIYVDDSKFLTSGAPATTTTNTTATVLTYALAGGILSTNKGVRIRVAVQSAITSANGGATYTIQYGGTTVGTFGYAGNSGTPTVTAVSVIDIMLLGSGATGTQRYNGLNNTSITSGSGGGAAGAVAQTGSSSVDSTVSQNITISCTAAASVTGTLLDYFIIKI